ncbi:MAG: phosphohistidine phosphatase SixA [Thermoleophilaceae bacterium]|nr:phosphohistidine phosphatase SixA [Thermoleophilaceae bacterium]
MAKQIWFLRHGEAEPHDSRADDADRPLTATGERQSEMVGRALARLGCEFEAIFASPKVRALDTAKRAAQLLGVEAVVHKPLGSGFDRKEALALAESYERVMVVGHEPDFSQVIGDLTGGRVDMKKGGVAAVRLDGSKGELIVLLRPKDLETLAV